MNQPAENAGYSQYFGVEATGRRIGLMVCKECGATVLLGDDEVDAASIHTNWHVRRGVDK